jgi:FkbM family methyltransferase
MLTYSQNYEDIILDRFFKHKETGFYIDVGAHDPDEISVTRKFYERGWRGINIEPLPDCIKKLEQARPGDINLQIAVAEGKDERVFHQLEGTLPAGYDASALSTFDGALARRLCAEHGLVSNEITVQVDSLKNICKSHVPEGQSIDFLKVDTEGHEEIVLKSADFNRYRPAVLVVEATKPNANPLATDSPEDQAAWYGFEGYLASVEYDFVYFDGLNRFYLAREHAERKGLFAIPVGIFDGVDYREQALRVRALEAEVESLKARFDLAQGPKRALAQQVERLSGALETEFNKRRGLAMTLHAWDAAARSSLAGRLLLPKRSLPKIPQTLRAEYGPSGIVTGSSQKISVITPSFNSGDTLERAIMSVLAQNYSNVEHIVVDGGSTDGTLDILKKYDHLRWLSEPDRGQVHAMNKGFELATGDVIAYLNADDFYESETFSAVMAHFTDETMMVSGNVEVYDEARDQWWTNKPRTDFESILHHWEKDAFCVNPVGYFYRREVQERVPYKEENGAKMDLAFLMEAALHFELQTRKIDRIFGVFMNTAGTRTVREQAEDGYWTPENFPFIDALLETRSEEFRERFRVRQIKGYEQRKKEPVVQAGKRAAYLPSTEYDLIKEQATRVDREKYRMEDGDPVAVFLSYGKVGSTAVCRALGRAQSSGRGMPVYHIHRFTRHPIVCSRPYHLVSGQALRLKYDVYRNRLKWQFITGVREPVSYLLSGYYENYFRVKGDPTVKDILTLSSELLAWRNTFMDRELLGNAGIDVYQTPFDMEKGYGIIRNDNISLLTYRHDRLRSIFSEAMHEYFGLEGLSLRDEKVGVENELVVDGVSYADSYRRMRKKFTLPVEELEEIYAHKSVTHFFSEEEIRELIKYWSTPGESRGETIPELRGNRRIVYDVGLHDGQDTEFYLKKGFRVVAVDANPAVVGAARERFARAVAEGRLVLLNIGIAKEATAEPLNFYVNQELTEWSSFLKEIALRDGHPYHVEKVACRTLASVIREHGAPYYVKIDIEGHDAMALESMLEAGIRPRYVSVENGNEGMLGLLAKAGYTQFKYVQQLDVPGSRAMVPAREGVSVDHEFPIGASGPFGDEAPGPWLRYEAVREAISRVWDPDGKAKNPDHVDARDGWFDLHARLGAEAGGGVKR